MSRIESGFRRLAAYTFGAVALLAFALFLNALFTTQSTSPGGSLSDASDPFAVSYLTGEGDDLEPAWSPDGRYIAYVSLRAGTYYLFVHDLNTGQSTQIAEGAWIPFWSPDGSRLAYAQPHPDGGQDTWVTDPSGASHVKVNDSTDAGGSIWLRDGLTILLSTRSGEIHAVTTDGSPPRVMPMPELWALSLSSLSPDGTHVLADAAARDPQARAGLVSIDVQTGAYTQVVPDDPYAGRGSWSPDGQYLAYSTIDLSVDQPAEGAAVIRVMRPDGSQAVTVAGMRPGFQVSQYAWSPDSRFIAYVDFPSSSVIDGGEVFVAWADGSQSVALLPGVIARTLSWSPDGTQLAVSVRNGDQFDIAILRADEASLQARLAAPEATGTPAPPDLPPQPSPSTTHFGPPTAAPTMTPPGSRDLYQLFRLTTSAEGEYRPAVSPDGQRIAYAGERDGNWDIYVFDWPTFSQIRLTDDPLNDMSPSWSPDGAHIAYQHNLPDPNGPALVERIIINVEDALQGTDGSGKRVVSRGAVWIGNEAPAWSPDGARIAFSDGKGVTVVNVADGREVMRFTPPDVSAYFQPAWFDGTHVAFSGDGALLLGDIDTGAVERMPNTTGFAHLPMTTAAFPRIAYFGLPGPAAQLQSIFPNGDEPYTLAAISANTIQHAAWSPDGRFIAYQTDGGVHLAVAWTPEYAAAAPLFSLYTNVAPSDLLSVSWLPNGSGFVFVGAMEGSSELYYAGLNFEAIQMYLANVPTTGPTPPPPPPPTQAPLFFGSTRTPYALPPAGTPPYWLQVLYHEGNSAMAAAGQHLWLVDWAGDALVSADGGAAWNAIKLPEPAQAIALSWRYGSDRTVYVAAGSTVYRSTDGGAAWTAILVGGDYASIALGADGSIFVAEESRCAVHRSIDGGATWAYAQVGPEGCTLAQIALSPSFPQDGVVYALGSSPGVWRSADRGVTWQMIDADVWTDLAVDLNDAALVYVANAERVRRIDVSGGGRGIDSAVEGVYLLAASPNGSLYAATWDGRVYESADRGAAWSEISTFSGEPIRDLVALDGVVYVAMERMLVGGYWEGAPVPATPGP